ncbi:hypothetical protein IRB23SM22_09130 [Alkalibacterium sp. s-m-22]|uniref:Uncharacterized protein n=3 Tax=Bacilli TaxID=91061 RepID=A0ABN1AIK5_9LACT
MGSVGTHSQKQSKENNIAFICQKCKVTEKIPKDVVKQLDFMDSGDPMDPPRFSCEQCDGSMVPLYYEGLQGITYDNRHLKRKS